MRLTSVRRYARFVFGSVTPATRVLFTPDKYSDYVIPVWDEEVSVNNKSLPESPVVYRHITVRLSGWVADRRCRARVFRWGYSPEVDTIVMEPVVRLYGGDHKLYPPVEEHVVW